MKTVLQGNRIPPAFTVMAKPSGPACNLDCDYCFYREKEHLFPDHRHYKMPDELLELFIRQKIEAHKSSQVHFAWQGGEPTLLGVPYFQRALELQKKYAQGKSITNSFQTNGVLIDDDWCRFFAQNQFLIGISLDGPRHIHDQHRLDKNGRSSFDQVIHAIHLLKNHGIEFNTLTVVHKENSGSALEIYNFLKEAGSGFMQFIPIVERLATGQGRDGLVLIPPDFGEEARVTEWSVDPLQYGQFLCAIFDEWVRKDVGKVFVQLFDVALEMWLGLPASVCVFGRTCGQAAVIEHNGDVYSCDHYVYPENKLGNLSATPLVEMLVSDKQKKFGNAKRDLLPGSCLSCEVRFACNGECPKHRFVKAEGEPYRQNYLCAGYRYFFNHIDPCMRYMSNEYGNGRAPANVMKWMKHQDALLKNKSKTE
jgi:uncharacterized protein